MLPTQRIWATSWLRLCLPTSNNSHLADEHNTMSPGCIILRWKGCVWWQLWWYSWTGIAVVIDILSALRVTGNYGKTQCAVRAFLRVTEQILLFRAERSTTSAWRKTESSTLSYTRASVHSTSGRNSLSVLQRCVKVWEGGEFPRTQWSCEHYFLWDGLKLFPLRFPGC